MYAQIESWNQQKCRTHAWPVLWDSGKLPQLGGIVFMCALLFTAAQGPPKHSVLGFIRGVALKIAELSIVGHPVLGGKKGKYQGVLYGSFCLRMVQEL